MTENGNTPSKKASGSKSNVVPLQTPPMEPPHRKVARFVHDHPVATVAGGLAVGMLAAALIPRGNRAYLARRASQWSDAVSAATVALAQQALERAEAAGSQVRNKADALADRAGEIGHAAKGHVERIGGAAADKTHEFIGRARSGADNEEPIAGKARRLVAMLRR